MTEELSETEELPDTLALALRECQLELPAETVDRLDQYCQLLWQWNQRLNLTRHTDYRTFVQRDMIDTLQLSQWLAADDEILDVGSGGGVPGVILAILQPQWQISLAESVSKKARALETIVSQLALPVPVHAERAEKILDDLRFTALVSRAVGPLWKMLSWFQPHWASVGRLVVIKGPRWVEERAEARHRGLMHGIELRRLASYAMPGTESESVILELRPSRE